MGKATEHETRGIIDRCPRCGKRKDELGIEGYRDYDFTDEGVYFEYVCPDCKEILRAIRVQQDVPLHT